MLIPFIPKCHMSLRLSYVIFFFFCLSLGTQEAKLYTNKEPPASSAGCSPRRAVSLGRQLTHY